MGHAAYNGLLFCELPTPPRPNGFRLMPERTYDAGAAGPARNVPRVTDT